MAKIEVLKREVQILSVKHDDYICITDIARYKDAERTDYLISNWMRNRNTIEFLGIWEQINNPEFNPIEFDGIKKIPASTASFSLQSSGSNVPEPLALFPRQAAMAAPMPTRILPLNLLHGFQLSSSSTLSRSSSVSRKKNTRPLVGISAAIWQNSITASIPMPFVNT
jgi:hypothetical protein